MTLGSVMGGGLATVTRNWAGGQKAVFYDIARIFRTKCADNAPTAYTENKQSIYALVCFVSFSTFILTHIYLNMYV